MTNEEKLLLFDMELNAISDDGIRKYTEQALLELPNYFWEVPASSTSKYHPKITQAKGGLSIHTKLATRILINTLSLEMMAYSDLEKSMAISAIILHDGAKKGIPETKHTIHDHPLVICTYLESKENLKNLLDPKIRGSIYKLIRSHMGQWTEVKYSKVVLPKPDTGLARLVHLADYLSSRQDIFDMSV